MIDQMNFSPPNGLRDKATYPRVPADEDAAREQVQGRLDEIKNYINNTLLPGVDAHKAENATDHDIIRLAKKSTGTANALAIDTAGTFDLTKDGNVLHLLPNLTNSGAVTVAVDEQAAKAVKEFNVDTDTFIDLVAGKLKKNTPAQLVWSVANGFFILRPSGAGSNIKSVQRGTATFPAGVTTYDVTISSVDFNKSIVKISSYTGSQNQNSQVTVAAEIIDNTTIRFRVYTAPVNAISIAWEVVEYINVKSLQRGNIRAATSANATITQVNRSKSELFFSYINESTANSFLAASAKGLINSDTNVNFVFGATGTAYWQVVEFD